MMMSNWRVEVIVMGVVSWLMMIVSGLVGSDLMSVMWLRLIWKLNFSVVGSSRNE